MQYTIGMCNNNNDNANDNESDDDDDDDNPTHARSDHHITNNLDKRFYVVVADDNEHDKRRNQQHHSARDVRQLDSDRRRHWWHFGTADNLRYRRSAHGSTSAAPRHNNADARRDRHNAAAASAQFANVRPDSAQQQQFSHTLHQRKRTDSNAHGAQLQQQSVRARRPPLNDDSVVAALVFLCLPDIVDDIGQCRHVGLGAAQCSHELLRRALCALISVRPSLSLTSLF